MTQPNHPTPKEFGDRPASPPWRRILLRGFLLLLLLLATACTTVPWWGARLIVSPFRRMRLDTPARHGLSAEEVTIRTDDGHGLRGWFIPAEGDTAPRGAVVLLHGLHDARGALVGDATALVARGFACLLYDQRGHGDSEGRYVTYGYRERHDVSRAIDWLEQRLGPDVRVGLVGQSFGAAVALCAAGIDPRIQAVVAISPFDDLRKAMIPYARLRFGPLATRGHLEAALARAEAMADFTADDARPIDAVRYTRAALLFVHGSDDWNIPPEASQRLHEAATSPVNELWLVPGAGHANVKRIPGPAFIERVGGFLETHLR